MSESITVATTERIELEQVEKRVEHDLLGDAEVPGAAYWGVHTKRAVENFPITGVPIGHFPELVRALAMVKKAAARANRKLGHLPRDKADAIEGACEAIMAGRFHDQFVVDAIQGGAGTSTNMNANEVIANVALEVMGRPKGDYEALHPNNHVNMSQSTNDAYPTAVRLAILLAHASLIKALNEHKLAGAALDVFPEEPLPKKSPLWEMSNVIITPHIAGISAHYDQRAMALFAENLSRYVADLPLYNVFDSQKGY